MRTVLLCLATISALPLLAADKPVEILAPSSKWQLDYGVNRCHMIRSFGEGSKQVIFRMVRYAPGDYFDLDLLGKRFASNAAYSNVTIDFGHDGTVNKREAFNGSLGKEKMLSVGNSRLVDVPGEITDYAQIKPMTLADESSVSSVYVRVNGSKPFKLALGSMAAPMKAMRTCTDNLVKSWGYDPVHLATYKRGPELRPESGQLLRDGDYPVNALSSGIIGVVQIRLDVNADGTVGGCKTLAETKPADFSTVVCKKASARAKFNPALDKDGNPVRSFMMQTVRFRI
jgi:Gram-negative bacterial TonB protein C-terminal